jgi:hypothetical protein
LLPLISPDGRFVATQTGIAPTWPTIVAGPEAEVPSLTRIEVYQLDRRTSVSESQRNAPVLMFSLAEPSLLGRSCDSEGFLIESPRENGSRWIGHVSWTTGDTLWLIDDDRVNAFATAGPDGRLAWSRRAVDEHHFELVVRLGDECGSNLRFGGDWLMPTWSGSGDGLSPCLQEGVLELVFAAADSEKRFAFAQHGIHWDRRHDFFGVSNACRTGNARGWRASQRDQLLYDHPAWARRGGGRWPVRGTVSEP